MLLTVTLDVVTKTIVPVRRKANPLNGKYNNGVTVDGTLKTENIAKGEWSRKATFMTWTMHDVAYVARYHWMPYLFAAGAMFFTVLEYTHQMTPASSQPFDLGFVATRSLHWILASSPNLNTALAALNTVLLMMEAVYFSWTWLVEGRLRATYAAIYIHVHLSWYSRLLYSAPSPSRVSSIRSRLSCGKRVVLPFLLRACGRLMIASLDLKRMKRFRLAMFFDILNVLQSIRLLGTRGHYTIDIVVGFGTGIVSDSLAGKYEERLRPSPLENLLKVSYHYKIEYFMRTDIEKVRFVNNSIVD